MTAGKGDRLRPVAWERYERKYERICGGDCYQTRTDRDKCPGSVTPDPDINPAVWEEKDG